MAAKKRQNLHNNLMANRVLTLDNVLNELKERKQFVSKVTKLPESDLREDDEDEN